MKKQNFPRSKYSKIMTFEAWQELQPLLPESYNMGKFFENNDRLLLNVIRFYLSAFKIPSTVSGSHYLPFGNIGELQCSINKTFIVIRIVLEFHSVVKNEFIKSTIRAGGRVWWVSSFDEFLEKVKTLQS